MNPETQNQPHINNPLASMQPGEQNIFEVRRHPFGMLTIYISAIVLLVVVAAIVFILGPIIFPDSKQQVVAYGSLILLGMAVIVGLYTFVAHVVYWGNRWILTSDSLTQITKSSIFDSQHSQLSLGNLEDVTASKDGLLAHIFNFGVLKAETAGERSKFVFNFCPNPDYYAQQILHAREVFEQRLESNEGAGRAYPTGVNVNAAPDQPVASYQVPTGDEQR